MAYSLWSFIAINNTIQIQQTIPLCVYNEHDLDSLDFPSKIQVTLQGKRKTLSLIDYKKLAAHLDGTSLKVGPNGIHISEENLFLPPTIKLVNYKPTNLIVMKKQ